MLLMKTIYLGLPAYNEELALPILLKRISEVRDLFEKKGIKLFVIINNDGSTDQTEVVAQDCLTDWDIQGIVISSTQNQGLGQGVRNILDCFLKISSHDSYLALMDADDTHDPNQLLEMLEAVGDKDVVIASRYARGSTTLGVPQLRLLTGHLARFYLQTLFPLSSVRDFTCGYRLYGREIISRLYSRNPKYFAYDGFAAMPELLLNLLSLKARCIEIPLQLNYGNKPTPSSMKVLKNSRQILKLGILSRFRRFAS